MLTVPEASKIIIERSRYLSEALSKDLINLSSLARYIKPEIEEMLIKNIQAIIQAKTLKIAKENLELLKTKKHFYKTNIQKIIIKQFKEKFNSLMLHLYYPERNIPHTNNDIENLFRQLNLNIKSIGRFNKFWNAHHYLNAWALKRRFTKFTDCKGWRKYRNAKAPLELAGCDIEGLDYLNL